MTFLPVAAALVLCSVAPVQAKPVDSAKALQAKGLAEQRGFEMLRELTEGVGHRVAGSAGADRAVAWGEATMRRLGFQNVRRQSCPVPRWVRGEVERGEIVGGGALSLCALGNSAGTPLGGLTAPVIEVRSLKEAEALGERARGKILFFNRPFDPTFVNPMQAYGAAGDQRFAGPGVAAKLGAAGALVRSLTEARDDVPHTGTTRFEGARIPAAALSLVAADRLSAALKADPATRVRMELSCETLPDGVSANVIGEIVGSERPKEVIAMGGHLDSWDKGTGAHDDGAGIVHALEALRLIKDLGWRPKRTIRVVLWMNEEISGTGAKAYADWAKTSGEKHIAAIESDSGGFAPRGFNTSLAERRARKVRGWLPALSLGEAERLKTGGGGGADIGPLGEMGTALFGLEVEMQRYFDYHHSAKDTIDKVHPRELELGAISMAILAWLISENGV